MRNRVRARRYPCEISDLAAPIEDIPPLQEEKKEDEIKLIAFKNEYIFSFTLYICLK